MEVVTRRTRGVVKRKSQLKTERLYVNEVGVVQVEILINSVNGFSDC